MKKLNLTAGHALLYTKNKDELIKQIKEPLFINKEMNQSNEVLSKIQENQDLKTITEIFLIVDTENKEDLSQLETIFNKGGGIGLRVLVLATNEIDFKENIGEELLHMIKDNVIEIKDFEEEKHKVNDAIITGISAAISSAIASI